MALKQSVVSPILPQDTISQVALIEHIAAIGFDVYEGYVGHEFEPRGDVIDALRQAYERCSVG